MNHIAFNQGTKSISYSNTYRDYARVAHWWEKTPDEFEAKDRNTRLNMVTIYEIENRIEALQAYEQRIEAEKRARKGKRKGKRR